MPWHLDHVQLAIPSASEARCDEFYVGVLGFEVVEKPPALAARGGRWYRRGDAVVHLGVDVDFRPAKKAHPAIVIEGYDELLARLTQRGLEFTPDEEIPGVRRCYVEDPVGNRVELIDETPRP